MAYGLEFYGNVGQLIFDTDNFDGGQTLVVTGSGTIGNGSTYTHPSNKIVFGKVSSGNMLGNVSSGVFTNYSGSTITYIEAEFTNNNTTNLETGTSYGLEVFDSSQNVTFSTRKTDKTITFLQIWDKGALTSETDVLYQDNSGLPSNLYVSIDYMWYSDSLNYANGVNFGSTAITYKGRFYLQDSELGTFDFAIPNLGTLGVVKVRG